MQSVIRAISGLWVIINMAILFFSLCRRLKTCISFTLSIEAVGSSIIRISGDLYNALAMPINCLCPPERLFPFSSNMLYRFRLSSCKNCSNPNSLQNIETSSIETDLNIVILSATVPINILVYCDTTPRYERHCDNW